MTKYNQIKQQIADLEYDLRRLRDPMYIRMSPTATNGYTTTGLHAKHFGRSKSSPSTATPLVDTIPEKPKPFVGGLSEIIGAAVKKLKK